MSYDHRPIAVQIRCALKNAESKIGDPCGKFSEVLKSNSHCKLRFFLKK